MDAVPHCARPGCEGPVAAWLSYDYARQTAWLDSPLGTADSAHWGLCGDHADGLRVPQGWSCEDRRCGTGASRAGPTAAPRLRPYPRPDAAARPVRGRSAPVIPAVAR